LKKKTPCTLLATPTFWGKKKEKNEGKSGPRMWNEFWGKRKKRGYGAEKKKKKNWGLSPLPISLARGGEKRNKEEKT